MRRSVLVPCGRGCKGAWQQAAFVVTRYLWTRVQPFSFASPSNDIGLVVTLPSPRLSGPFRTTPLLLDKAATPDQRAAIKPCSLVRQELYGLRAQIKKGEFDEKDYFFTNTEYEGKNVPEVFKPRADLLPDVVRCKECGKTIAEHAASPGVAKPKPKTYDEALKLTEDGGTVAEPRTKSKTLVGRHGFAEKIHEAIVELNPLSTQDSCSLILQNASGVGKTFATITARRALMELAKRNGLAALDYEPVVVYLGLNQNFKLLDEEGAFMSNQGDESSREGAVRSVLFQRLNFTLHHTLEAIKAKGSVAAALDSTDPTDWRQRLAEPKESLKDYRFCTDIAKRHDDSKVKELCDGIQKLAGKKLVILTVLDEAQYLDRCIPPNTEETGGARLALRVLRDLQVSMYNNTVGQILLLPIATGLNAKVSLGAVARTNGENVVLGWQSDEALMKREDFVTLAHTFLKNRVATVNIPIFVLALYPHVRELTKFAQSSKFPTLAKFTITLTGAQNLVVAAFLGDKMKLSSFPVQSIPHLPEDESDGIPVLSFLAWQRLNDCLKDGIEDGCQESDSAQRWPLPFREIHEEQSSRPSRFPHDFEAGCFHVLVYFLRVFGPVLERVNSDQSAVIKWLRSGSDTLEGFPKMVVKRLANGQGQCNPSTSPSIDEMASRDLATDFVDLVQKALRICAKGEDCAVWVHCGGKAPLDFLLLVLRPDKTAPKRVEVQLRFADAKHTIHPQLQNKAKLFDEMHSKAKHLREVLVNKLPAIDRTKEFDFSKETYSDAHLMLCHNQPDANFFSPSTFTWSPWSQLLFWNPQASAGTSQDATSTSAGKPVHQHP